MGKRITVLLGPVFALMGAGVEANSADSGHQECCPHHGGVCGCAN